MDAYTQTTKPFTNEPLKGFYSLAITSVRHYTDNLFHFTVERPAAFRFRSGEFVMMGLMVDQKPLLRAYSIASPNWADELGFYSIKVQNGPLTSRLKEIAVGDHILMRTKAVGTLVFDALLPGRRLFLLSTGTGIAPFASIIRDPEVYEKFEKIYLIQTARLAVDLTYGKDLVIEIRQDELLGEMSAGKLEHLACTTREASEHMGRISNWIIDGRLATFAGGVLNPKDDRVMICGSVEMLRSLKGLCEELGFKEGANSAPGEFVIEKAFAD